MFPKTGETARKKGLNGPQDQAQILAGCTQHHVDGITGTAFEPVAVRRLSRYMSRPSTFMLRVLVVQFRVQEPG
jgi:hypothetical protein